MHVNTNNIRDEVIDEPDHEISKDMDNLAENRRMTTHHVSERANHLTPYRRMMSMYGIFACFMESLLNLSGSSMFNRQMSTASAGITPSPREPRQTARRWFGPKLQIRYVIIDGRTKHDY